MKIDNTNFILERKLATRAKIWWFTLLYGRLNNVCGETISTDKITTYCLCWVADINPCGQTPRPQAEALLKKVLRIRRCTVYILPDLKFSGRGAFVLGLVEAVEPMGASA